MRLAIVVIIVVCGFVTAWALLVGSGETVVAQDSRQSDSGEDPTGDLFDEEDIGGGGNIGDEPGANSPNDNPPGSPPGDQNRPSPSPPPRPSPPVSLNPGTLMEAGGSDEGPMPKMPGGGCPKEFPVEKENGCYGAAER